MNMSFFFILSFFLKDENKSSHNISMMQMKNENYEIIQQKKRKNNENFQLGRVIHMADKASSTGILKPELHVTVQEQLYMQSGDVAVTQPLSM